MVQSQRSTRTRPGLDSRKKTRTPGFDGADDLGTCNAFGDDRTSRGRVDVVGQVRRSVRCVSLQGHVDRAGDDQMRLLVLAWGSTGGETKCGCGAGNLPAAGAWTH